MPVYMRFNLREVRELVKETGRPDPGQQKTLRELLIYARPYRHLFIGVIGLVLIYNLTQVSQPYLVKIAIDRYLLVQHPVLRPLFEIGIAYLGITLIGLISNLIQTRLIALAGQQIVRQIRVDLFQHIESLSMQYFERHDSGRLLTNVSSDTTRISQFFTQFLLSVIRDGLTILLVLGAMLVLNWKLGLLSALVIPPIVVISIGFRPRLRQSYNTTRSRLSRLIGFVAENLTGMRITQVFHQEPKQFAAFATLNQGYQDASVTEYRWDVLFNRSFDLLGNLAVAFVAWLGGLAVLHHGIQLGVLYAFISYIQQFFAPINALTQNWNTLQSSMISAERVSNVLATNPTLEDPKAPVVANFDAPGGVRFDRVGFAYDRMPILKDVSLSIGPGEFVGIVGETGAGKSTLISLLTRFYDVSQGSITIDGTDIREFRQADLHRLVAVVQQEVHLYSGTVADNIRLFRPDIGIEQIIHAARTTGADDFIQQLPQGYETWLTPRGSNLSTGQRQLLAFARTVILNPRILVLDEATANLDAVSEIAVQKGLVEVAKHRTTIVIAHRLSTVRAADAIYVMDQGQVVERGTHLKLMALGGTYYKLVKQAAIDGTQQLA